MMTTQIILLLVGTVAFFAACGILDLFSSGPKTSSSTANSAATDQADNTQLSGVSKSNVAADGGVLLQSSNVTSPDSVLLQGNSKLNLGTQAGRDVIVSGLSGNELEGLVGKFLEASQSQIDAFTELVGSQPPSNPQPSPPAAPVTEPDAEAEPETKTRLWLFALAALAGWFVWKKL